MEGIQEMNEQELTNCSQGHRSTFSIKAKQGGSICLFCLSNLITNPRTPTFHVSYALSHLSIALSYPPTLRFLLASHPLFLVSPLVCALSMFDDEPIARQIFQIVTSLCGSHNVRDDFVTRVADHLSAGSFTWSRRHAFMLHCFGVILNCAIEVPYIQNKTKEALVSNLVSGLQLPSEEICGEILFVLYKLSILPNMCIEGDRADCLFGFCPILFRLSLEILMKTQNNTVQLNCIALLTILVRKGFLDTAFLNEISSMNWDEADNIMQTRKPWSAGPPLEVLFAEAVKGPLLSSDRQLQTSVLDLIFHYLSRDETPTEIIQALVEENIVDYVFEVLRLSEYKDPLISCCILVLDRLSKAEKGFKERLPFGVSSLLPALQLIAEVPLHPLQYQILKLMWDAVSDNSVLLLTPQVEELVIALTRMLKKYCNEEFGMSPETFIMGCSLFVALIESPSFDGSYNLISSVVEASSHAILSCLNIHQKDSGQLLHALILLKKVYGYSQKDVFVDVSSIVELRHSIVDICASHLLPWVIAAFNDVDKEVVIELLEAFHFILLHDSDNHTTQFAQFLFSSSWFSLSFAFLGLFPEEKMKQKVYVVLSSLVDILLGNNNGQTIRDSAISLPSDPTDLLFLLGQKSTNNTLLSSCQSAILLIMHAGFLHNDRFADEKSVLASLEQFILVNSSDLLFTGIDCSIFIPLVNLYSISRFVTQKNGQINYSADAERILFHHLSESEWNFPSSRFHMLSLKWLFQQEKVTKVLSFQILKLCRSCSLDGTDVLVLQENSQDVNMQFIAELATADDNYVARLCVCLLLHLVEESKVLDIVHVIKFLATVINFSPSSADQLCVHGIGHAIKSCLNSLSHSSPPEIFRATILLIFKILCSVNYEALHDDDGWLGVTVKLVDCISYTLTEKCWSDEAVLVIAIFSIILRHSTNGALLESSKVVLLSPALACIIDSLIQEFCTKGPGSRKYEMGRNAGNSLILVLVLWYFSLKSLHVLLPGHANHKNLLERQITTRPLTMVYISCHDLCRLMHFGSSLVKLVASYSLLEIMSRLLEQRENTNDEPNCLMDHLLSTMAVLEGLIFYSDIRVSMNCSRCLCMILEWDKLIMKDTRIAVHNTWVRLIIEEMVMLFAVPRMTSKLLINQHKPAICILIALLKLQTPPRWMRTVLLEHHISSIIKNVATSDLSAEAVILFRELLNSGFLNTQQVDCLNWIFQEYRKLVYDGDDSREEDIAKRAKISDDLEEVCEYLVHLISSDAYPEADYVYLRIGERRLLEEIDTFLRISAVKHIPNNACQ